MYIRPLLVIMRLDGLNSDESIDFDFVERVSRGALKAPTSAHTFGGLLIARAQTGRTFIPRDADVEIPVPRAVP